MQNLETFHPCCGAGVAMLLLELFLGPWGTFAGMNFRFEFVGRVLHSRAILETPMMRKLMIDESTGTCLRTRLSCLFGEDCDADHATWIDGSVRSHVLSAPKICVCDQ